MARGGIPSDERERLAEVKRLARAVDEEISHLEHLTRDAALFFRVPIAVITLVDQDRVWVKSRFGIDITQVKRENSLCELAVQTGDLLVIPDTLKDPLACSRAMVTSAPGVRFYAAAPIRSRFGYNVGALCIMDVHPRTLSDQDGFVLRLMGELASRQMESLAEPSSSAAVRDDTFLAEIFAGGPTVVFKWRAAEGWPVEYVSPNVSQFGYLPEDFTTGGLLYANIVHPEDLDRVEHEVEMYSHRGDESFTQEYRILRKSGQACWVYDYTLVARNAEGRITHYMGYILDITARKEADIALRESWAKYEAAVEGFDGLVYVCSPEFKIEYMNRRLTEKVGPQAMGAECFKAIFGRKSPCPCCTTSSVLQNQTIRWEGFSDSDKRWYHVAITPWQRANGCMARLVMAHDITDRKEHEMATLRRDAILSNVAQMADLLLRTSEWRQAMPAVLSLLGQGADADRAYLMENRSLPDGRVAATMCAEWTTPGVPSRIYAPLSHEMAYDQPGFRSWADSLKSGRSLEAYLEDIPEPQRSYLREQGIRSLVAIPVFVGRDWWGFLGFDFCTREKRCTPVVLDALRTAAGLLGNVLMRYRFETALQKSDAQQKILLKAIPDLMFRLRSDGTFLDYKADRTEDLAVPPDRIIGNKIQDLLPAPLASLTLSHIRRALQTSQPQIFEYDLNLRGTLRRYETRMVVSGPDEVLAIVRDITDAHLNQLLLRTLWCAVDQMPDMAFITDAEGRFVYVNKAFETITGYTSAEVLGHSPALLKSGKHDADFYKWLWTELLSNRTVHTEFINRRKDGSLYTQETTIIPIAGADRCIAHFVAVAKDVTEARRTEQTIRKLAAFPEANPNIVIELDRDGLLLYVNPAARDMAKEYGYTEVADLLPSDYRVIVRQCLETMTERRRVEKVLPHHTLSWSFFPVAVTKTVHAYGTDITERRAMETQLRHLQKMEAIGRLAGGIAHDFNNILTAILGYASMLQSNESLPPDVRGEIHEITAAAERAAHLTQQLLAFSRRQVMQRVPIAINATIERLGHMLRRLIHENTSLEFNLTSNLPGILADPNTLEQVVTNLVINARDAMPNGGTIRISTGLRTWSADEARRHPEAKPAPTVYIEVADEGMGMTDEVKSHLFEPFFTTKEKGRGTGLGLATAYGIVRQHEGWFEVDSQPGRGSTFRVYLPVAETAARTDESSRSEPVRRAGKETVLIVEDEDRVRTLTATLLTASGYSVLQSNSGHEALELWKKHKSDIAVLIADVVMPGGLSGTELAERLYAEKKSLGIILISGYSQDAATVNMPANCPHLFLAKPFSPADLTQALARILEFK